MPTRLVAFLFCALVALVRPAHATWSIVVVDMATGEVCIAAATCIANEDLRELLPVIVVGRGGGAAQALVGGDNKSYIWNGLIAGDTPQQILAALAAGPTNHQCRQYGIVDFENAPVTFSGSNGFCVGNAQFGVAGTSGTLRYAIQGNVLTDDSVVLAAESALLGSGGDLGQRVMAAMEAARALGGDGRCSCSQSAPTSCGAPPPGFTKSAYISFVQLARIGDTDGICTTGAGCANGDYYLSLAVKGNPSSPLDPVVSLKNRYDTWRNGLAGRPDHVLSEVNSSALRLPADGATQATHTVRLVDVDGALLTNGGASVTITASAGLVGVGTVTDNGDGTYTFATTAGTSVGVEDLEIVVDDGVRPVRLYPDLRLDLDPAAELHCGFASVPSSGDAFVPVTLDLGVARAGWSYIVLGSASGTTPGTPYTGGVLPLVYDAVTEFTLLAPGPPFLPGSIGQLDASGRATAALAVPSATLAFLVGVRIDLAALATDGGTAVATNAAGFVVM
jgi:uncharacterized Ntn-hydrolase superfamily protein